MQGDFFHLSLFRSLGWGVSGSWFYLPRDTELWTSAVHSAYSLLIHARFVQNAFFWNPYWLAVPYPRASRTCSGAQITWEDNSRRQHDDTDVQFVIYCCSVCYLLLDTFLGVRVELINSEYVWSMIGLLGFLLRDLHMPCRTKPN